MRCIRWPAALFGLMLACGPSEDGRGVGDEPPATVPTGPGPVMEQVALLLAAGERTRTAAERVRSAGFAPAATRLAAIVAADHAALDSILRTAADSAPSSDDALPAPGFATESAYFEWQAALDSTLLSRLADEPGGGLAGAELREVLRQAAPTLAAHRRRALQLRDSLRAAPVDTANDR